MPSPLEDRPGLLIRDSFRFSPATLILPPPLVQFLEMFDGETPESELKEALVRMTGDIRAAEVQQHLCQSLSEAGFLHDERFDAMREAALLAFRDAPQIEAAHAGVAYPDDEAELEPLVKYWMRGAETAPQDGWIGLAAPHVSPEGGLDAYRDAYRLASPSLKDRLFIVLGTSHYGEPGKFGLTRKPFRTPFGLTRTENSWVDLLERQAGGAVVMEDYCHAVEHSIEFQVIYLQSIFGPDIRVLPILCGSFGQSIADGTLPESDENIHRFLDALAGQVEKSRQDVFWVLGVDMAHMGVRYGDPFEARENQNEMLEVAARDRHRIDRIAAGDAEGFWQAVQENRDDLKWCGSAPFYTFLRAEPAARAELQRYQQWNIDPRSVVTFAGLGFRR